VLGLEAKLKDKLVSVEEEGKSSYITYLEERLLDTSN
jgi:hypothetical protein